MAKSKATSIFKFEGVLSSVKGGLIHTVIYLPDAIVERLPEGRSRAKGTLNGIPFALAPQRTKEGLRYFAVNASLRKAAGISEGSKVKVEFKLVDPDAVDIPEELQAVLDQDKKAMNAWNEFTSGHQRNIIIYINSVKSVDARIRRSLEVMEKAKLGVLPGAKKKKL